jgi:hypothetical protein
MSKLTGVTPSTPISNRRTGAATQFGARRAFTVEHLLNLLSIYAPYELPKPKPHLTIVE